MVFPAVAPPLAAPAVAAPAVAAPAVAAGVVPVVVVVVAGVVVGAGGVVPVVVVVGAGGLFASSLLPQPTTTNAKAATVKVAIKAFFMFLAPLRWAARGDRRALEA